MKQISEINPSPDGCTSPNQCHCLRNKRQESLDLNPTSSDRLVRTWGLVPISGNLQGSISQIDRTCHVVEHPFPILTITLCKPAVQSTGKDKTSGRRITVQPCSTRMSLSIVPRAKIPKLVVLIPDLSMESDYWGHCADSLSLSHVFDPPSRPGSMDLALRYLNF